MKPEDIKSEILAVLELCDKIYSTFGLSYRIELSTRPEKNTIGSDEDWEIATTGLREALAAWGRDYEINEGDGAFYGPKIDLHVADAIGRSWQCGTIQLDMSLPTRFQLEYDASDGTSKKPIMVHRAIYGSIERFMAVLIEHFAGKFPAWLNPRPVRLIVVADRHTAHAIKILDEIRSHGIPCDIDNSHESVSKKVRLAQMEQVNYMLIIGDQECENDSVSLRTRDNVVYGEMKTKKFLETLYREVEDRSLESYFVNPT